jgi:uncharacterized membrane-anchored protein YhcB (DUF1043 family)
MLRFFRQIRQRLLTDNKFSKYLLYAIGEILLVVIGILIALQMDNANKSREEQHKEKQYLVQLTEELRSEIQYLRQLSADFKKTNEGLKRITNQWQSGDSQIKDSTQYLIDYTSVGLINPWYSEPVTWTLLQQTGDLTLIRDNDLKKDLFIYYSTVKKAADNYLQHPMEMVKRARRDMDMPFLNDSESLNVILNYTGFPGQEFSSNNFNKEVFALIWENRNELLRIFIPQIGVSYAQYMIMENLASRGELLLEKLEAVQTSPTS